MPDLTLDFRYLKYALLVAEHGSFRRVAEILNIPQTTVSRRVQLLERRLGVVLFERSRAGTRPTLAGERFMREAAVGAGFLQQAAMDIASAQRGDRGELRIGLMASLARGFLADLLGLYHRRFPDVAVVVEEGTAQASIAGVVDRRLDAAFVPGQPSVPGCEVKHLWEEQLFAAVPLGHRLAMAGRVAWSDLRSETFLVSAEVHGPEVEGIIVRQLSRLGFRPRISTQRVGRENLMNMVGKGFGMTLTASSTVGASYPGVTFVPVDQMGEIVSSSVIWSTVNRNPALKPLLDLSMELACSQ